MYENSNIVIIMSASLGGIQALSTNHAVQCSNLCRYDPEALGIVHINHQKWGKIQSQ